MFLRSSSQSLGIGDKKQKKQKKPKRNDPPMCVSDLVSLRNSSFSFQCPLCGSLMMNDAADDLCPLHRARDASHDEAKDLLSESLARGCLSGWDAREKSLFIQVWCSAVGRVVGEKARVEGVVGGRRKNGYSVESEERFCSWFRGRWERRGGPRVELALQLRTLYGSEEGHEVRKRREQLKRAEEEAREKMEEVREVRRRKEGLMRAVEGLERAQKEGGEEKAKEKRRELEMLVMKEEQLIGSVEIVRYESVMSDVVEMEKKSGVWSGEEQLRRYENAVRRVRGGDGALPHGAMFELECEKVVRDLVIQNKEGFRVERGVRFPGVQLPERATGELDYVVMGEDGSVEAVVECKRGCGQVRGNVMKKMACMKHLTQSDWGKVITPGGMVLSREAFAPLAPDVGFFDRMWFITRDEQEHREDVWGMQVDSEDCFIGALLAVPDMEILSEPFMHAAYEWAKEFYPFGKEDEDEFLAGCAAFEESLKRGRVIVIRHEFDPNEFGLPLNLRSSITPDEWAKLQDE